MRRNKALELVSDLPPELTLQDILGGKGINSNHILIEKSIRDKETEKIRVYGVHAVSKTGVRMRIEKVTKDNRRTMTKNTVIDGIPDSFIRDFQSEYADMSTVELAELFSTEPEEI